MEATLNVRMQASLKERGDKVLREHNVSTSEAVRALWKELAETRELPAFLKRETHNKDERMAKINAVAALSGIAEGSLSSLSDEELAAVGMARYE